MAAAPQMRTAPKGRPLDVTGEEAHAALDLLLALEEEWCNGCRQPSSRWGPVCPGMTQGDYTHFHSREWWLARHGRLLERKARGVPS